MIKYDLTTVYDYINGNDIDKDVNELENDKSFMKLVLKVSKDKKMFFYCSDNIKNDLSFLADVASIFSNDHNFIYDLFKKFIADNKDNPLERMEGALVACKFIKDEDLLFEFRATANVVYIVTISELASILEEENDEYVKSKIGKGFMILKDHYAGYPLATDFCAKKLLEEIFDEIPNLESYLHMSFNSSQKLKDYGICNFIINQASYKDNELATYLMMNSHLTDDIKRLINKYIKNWDNFEKCNRKNKIEAVYTKVLEYLMDNSIYTRVDLDLFIYYILSKYGIDKEIYELDPIVNKKHYDKIIELIKSGLIDESKFTDEEIRHMFAIESIIKDVTSQRVYHEEDPYVKANNVIILKFTKDNK